MTKEKITISVDERLLGLIDRQRGDTKRSTYINTVLEEYFNPRPPEDKGGGTFVTTLELRKTLKSVHDRVSRVEALDTTVRDLEALVYEAVYDVKERNKVKITKGSAPALAMASGLNEKTVRKVDKWIDGLLEKHNSITVTRDFPAYMKLDDVEQSQIAFTRHLRRNGLEYDHNKARWYKP